MEKLFMCCMFTVLFANSSLAQTKIRFAVKKISSHIYIVHPEKVNRVNNTSVIILCAGYLTVVESQTDEFMATELLKIIRSNISKLPVKYLVNTHFHLDHTLGTNAFLKENPAITIITHEATAKILIQKGEGDKQQLAEGLLQKSISTRKQSALEKNKQKRSELLAAANAIEKYSKDISASTIVYPNLTFKDSLTIGDSSLHIKLKFLGAGHTPGDIVLLVPEEKFLVAGDLVHDFEPLFWDADVDSWLLVLDKVKALDFDYFVGGHGDVHKGKEIIDFWKGYMSEVKVKTNKAIKDGMSLTDFQKGLSLESFTSLRRNDYGKRIQYFRTSFMGDVLTGSVLEAIKSQMEFVWSYYYSKKIDSGKDVINK